MTPPSPPTFDEILVIAGAPTLVVVIVSYWLWARSWYEFGKNSSKTATGIVYGNAAFLRRSPVRFVARIVVQLFFVAASFIGARLGQVYWQNFANQQGDLGGGMDLLAGSHFSEVLVTTESFSATTLASVYLALFLVLAAEWLNSHTSGGASLLPLISIPVLVLVACLVAWAFMAQSVGAVGVHIREPMLLFGMTWVAWAVLLRICASDWRDYYPPRPTSK